MLLLYGILTAIDRLQYLHFLTSHFYFFFYKFPIVLSPQIDWHGLQWDSFLSVLTVPLVMTQVRLPKPNQISARQRVTLELTNKTEAHERLTLITQVQRV